MPSETEVLSCPACKHLVRVPADWLGQTVQCPECQASFTAPRREGGTLTDAVLISTPQAVTAATQRRTDLMLMLPAFGLLLLGFTSLVVNGWTALRFLNDPAAADQQAAAVFDLMKGEKTGEDVAKENEAKASAAKMLRVLIPAFAVVSALVFLGGAAMASGRSYRLAQLGCVLATVNLPNGCCVPGAAIGLWGMIVLFGDEGRAHFVRGIKP